jgi:hypothetical protein
MKLTGKALVDLAREIEPDETLEWDALSDEQRCDTVRLVEMINHRYIAPLAQLALDWQKLAEDQEVLVAGEYVAFDQRWAELKQRTQQLVGEEQAP